ncbi:MAG: hypothetical protein QXE14_03455 [Candidatus Bathyarchaeia archaeon]
MLVKPKYDYGSQMNPCIDCGDNYKVKVLCRHKDREEEDNCSAIE